MNNDQPVMFVYPQQLSDEQAYALSEFVYELVNAIERHYGVQIRRHYEKLNDYDPDNPF